MFAYRTQVYPPVALVYRASPCPAAVPALSVYRAALPPCNLYTDIHTAPTIYRHAHHAVCIPLSIGIYRTFPPAPLHMPLRRSYFVSDGLLLLGYKCPALVVKMRYSLIMAVWRLLLDVRLFWRHAGYTVYRVLRGVGWGIYYILRGAGYSLNHTPHIKRGEIRRLACVRPLLARLS